MKAYACGGTPADCTMMGVKVLFPGVEFDFVVSGINRGDNAGLHVIYSGTVAGAREGAINGGAWSGRCCSPRHKPGRYCYRSPRHRPDRHCWPCHMPDRHCPPRRRPGRHG